MAILFSCCRFCRKRFYGDNEIFAHMQQQHEHCFLCRRERPDKYVYYRDYNELEGNSRSCNCISSFGPGLRQENGCDLQDSALLFSISQHVRVPLALTPNGCCMQSISSNATLLAGTRTASIRNSSSLPPNKSCATIRAGNTAGICLGPSGGRLSLFLLMCRSACSLTSAALAAPQLQTGPCFSSRARVLNWSNAALFAGSPADHPCQGQSAPACNLMAAAVGPGCAVLIRSGRARGPPGPGHHDWRPQRHAVTLPAAQCQCEELGSGHPGQLCPVCHLPQPPVSVDFHHSCSAAGLVCAHPLTSAQAVPDLGTSASALQVWLSRCWAEHERVCAAPGQP